MADVIFSAGTCKKKDIIKTMVDLMKTAGWKDVSSNPTTDFIVLNSKGEAGNKDLFIQFRTSAANNANPIDSTDYNVASYRLIEGYTPGAAGAAGVFARPSESWKALHIVPSVSQISQEVTMTYYYHVNKDRIIFIAETPESVNTGPITHYFGLPLIFTNDTGSRGVVAVSSAYSNLANGLLVSNAAGELPSDNASSTRIIYATLPPKTPNSAGKHTPVEMYYGNTSEGIRGKLDGLYVLPAGGLNNGDTLTVGSKTFRAVVNGVGSTNSFPSTTLVCQIS